MIFELVTLLALLLSATCWLASALVPIPKRVDVSFSGTGADVDRLVKGLHLQSRLNALGAVFAGIGVVCSAFG